MTLLLQTFLAVLASQTIVGLCNSLFILSDPNVTLALFGFYACAQSSSSGYICYIFFCSILSVILDGVRLLLWQPELLGHSVGILGSLQSIYLVLLMFGIAIKVIGGILAFMLLRKNSTKYESSEAYLKPPRTDIAD
eukprot:TRINITY_DN8425_c0_g1_i1.p1 TRINITY_DN8425_c0_g1~~TRINITY_DN8425_c0_g1_i1.p1  ORF type:complete len:137 (+),score=9.40 TRINITY_DN8425_c0_g1_i1:23-433(+)